ICCTPASLHASISDARIRRDELAISIVFSPIPWQNWRRPPLEPPEPTTGVLNSGNALPNSSATMLAKGRTVDEPAIWIVSRDCAAAAPIDAATAIEATAAVRKNLFIGPTPARNSVGRLDASGVAITDPYDSQMTVLRQPDKTRQARATLGKNEECRRIVGEEPDRKSVV